MILRAATFCKASCMSLFSKNRRMVRRFMLAVPGRPGNHRQVQHRSSFIDCGAIWDGGAMVVDEGDGDITPPKKPYGCFQKIGVGPPKWMVYDGKPY